MTIDSDQNHRLMEAAESGDFDSVLGLIRSGVEVDHRDQLGNTALFYAALRAHTKIMDELLHAGSDINISNNDGATPLLAAVLSGHVSAVELLLRAGAAVSVKNSFGRTPVQAAIELGFRDIASLLNSFSKRT
jgi:ankyrin repeat protein